MATITNAQVTTRLAEIHAATPNWFGPFDNVRGVTDNTTNDDEDFTFNTENDTSITMNFLELSNDTTARQEIFAVMVDAVLAKIATSDYGPFTRVTALANLPHESLNVPRIEVTNINGNTLFLSYDQLVQDVWRNVYAAQVEGANHKVETIIATLEKLKTVTDAMTAPYSREDYNIIVSSLQSIPEIRGYI